MKIRNETRRSRTLKGIGTKAFGFHNTAITVPPCGSQKKSARSPKASWKLMVTWVDRRMLGPHVANRWDSLWALPSRGTPGCSRWRAGPLQPGSRRRSRPPCWSWRREGPQPGSAEGLAWDAGGSEHHKHPEEAAAPPAQTRRSSGASLCNSRATVFDTDLDILDLSPVHQLTFQDLQALRSQRHNTLKHLNTPKHTCWLNTAHLWRLPLSHHAITDLFYFSSSLFHRLFEELYQQFRLKTHTPALRCPFIFDNKLWQFKVEMLPIWQKRLILNQAIELWVKHPKMTNWLLWWPLSQLMVYWRLWEVHMRPDSDRN